MNRHRKTKILLTERALRDISDIESYSLTQWGRRTAARYIDELQAALLRLKEKPELLRPEPEFHPDLCFYRVNKHVLACDVHPEAIYVLTVIHASRDIPSRLAELQPMLAAEVGVLRIKLRPRRKKR